MRLGVGEAVDHGEQTTGDQDRARHVQLGARGVTVVGEQDPAAREGDEGDGDVHVEGPAPVEGVGQHAAEQEAHRAAGAGDGAVDAERPGALTGVGERRVEQGQRGRCEQCAGDTLEGACGDQHLETRGGTAERGGGGEADDTGEEGGLPAEQVGDATTEQQEGGEREGVRGDDPLPVAVGEAEVLLGRRQGDVHDGGVEDHHQLSDGDDREDPPPLRGGRLRLRGTRAGAFGQSLLGHRNHSREVVQGLPKRKRNGFVHIEIRALSAKRQRFAGRGVGPRGGDLAGVGPGRTVRVGRSMPVRRRRDPFGPIHGDLVRPGRQLALYSLTGI